MTSPSFQQALADFGREIGITDLAPGPHGGAHLRFDSGASLGIDPQDDQVLVHLSEPLRHDVAATVLKAMKRSAQPQPGEPLVQVGLRSTTAGDWLLMGTRLPAAECDARLLGQRAGQLREWFARLQRP